MDISHLQNSQGYIEIAAFDHRGSIKKMMPEEWIPQFKKLLAETFGDITTTILVDPQFGQDAISIAKQSGHNIIMPLEKTGYVEKNQERLARLDENFTAQKLKEIGASAIKLLIYYNSEASNKNSQLDILKKAYDDSRSVSLPLLVEPITYAINGKPYHRGDSILHAVQEVQNFADILKIEYPVDPLNEDLEDAIPYLHEISSITDKPWVLLSRGAMGGFDNYLKACEIAKSEGCSGYAVGRAVWKRDAEMSSWDQIEKFIKTTGKERMEKLSSIFGPTPIGPTPKHPSP